MGKTLWSRVIRGEERPIIQASADNGLSDKEANEYASAVTEYLKIASLHAAQHRGSCPFLEEARGHLIAHKQRYPHMGDAISALHGSRPQWLSSAHWICQGNYKGCGTKSTYIPFLRSQLSQFHGQKEPVDYMNKFAERVLASRRQTSQPTELPHSAHATTPTAIGALPPASTVQPSWTAQNSMPHQATPISQSSTDQTMHRTMLFGVDPAAIGHRLSTPGSTLHQSLDTNSYPQSNASVWAQSPALPNPQVFSPGRTPSLDFAQNVPPEGSYYQSDQSTYQASGVFNETPLPGSYGYQPNPSGEIDPFAFQPNSLANEQTHFASGGLPPLEEGYQPQHGDQVPDFGTNDFTSSGAPQDWVYGPFGSSTGSQEYPTDQNFSHNQSHTPYGFHS